MNEMIPRRVLRPRPRDSDTALDGLRVRTVRNRDVLGGPDGHPGARLHVAHLVHAGEVA